MFKAPTAQEAVGPNPTDRGKKGSKRHLLVDGRGVPLSLIVTGANAHDVTQLDAVLHAMVVKRTAPTVRRSKHLCADTGYTGHRAKQIIDLNAYISSLTWSIIAKRRELPAEFRLPTVNVLDGVSGESAASMEAAQIDI